MYNISKNWNKKKKLFCLKILLKILGKLLENMKLPLIF